MHWKSFFIYVVLFYPLLSFSKLTLLTNQRNEEWTYIIKNNFACPVQVLFRYTNEQKNEETKYLIIPAYSEQIALILTNKKEPIFRFMYELGDPFLEPEDVEYWLPLAPGQVARVTQGYNTRFSHKGKNAYSIDFALPIGTPVYAARDGVVVLVKDTSFRGGNRKIYRGMANYIVIYHNDGTFSHYVHLKYKGSVVKPGDKVTAGQLIGYSGNTGWTKGPHLHFMVTRAGYMDRFSIPTKFYSSSGPLTNLVAKNFYVVEHPSVHLAMFLLTNTNSLATNTIDEDENNIGAP